VSSVVKNTIAFQPEGIHGFDVLHHLGRTHGTSNLALSTQEPQHGDDSASAVKPQRRQPALEPNQELFVSRVLILPELLVHRSSAPERVGIL
jgi:hypothetical protein